jgi:hypothetical protein
MSSVDVDKRYKLLFDGIDEQLKKMNMVATLMVGDKASAAASVVGELNALRTDVKNAQSNIHGHHSMGTFFGRLRILDTKVSGLGMDRHTPTAAPTVTPTQVPVQQPTVAPTLQQVAQNAAKSTVDAAVAQATPQPTAAPKPRATRKPKATAAPTAAPTVPPTPQPTQAPKPKVQRASKTQTPTGLAGMFDPKTSWLSPKTESPKKESPKTQKSSLSEFKKLRTTAKADTVEAALSSLMATLQSTLIGSSDDAARGIYRELIADIKDTHINGVDEDDKLSAIATYNAAIDTIKANKAVLKESTTDQLNEDQYFGDPILTDELATHRRKVVDFRMRAKEDTVNYTMIKRALMNKV